LTGIAQCSLEELQTVATNHGETLVDLFLLIEGPLRGTCRVLARPAPGAASAGRPYRNQGRVEFEFMDDRQ
jgi:hypothetical protein